MKYRHAPIEIESPEELGYDKIQYNVAESSVPDVSLAELGDLRLEPLILQYGEGFRIDVDRLEKLITPETRLVSLTCPHNPTGTVMTESELARVIEGVERHRCYLLFDETYRDMTFGKPLPLAASLSPRAISVSSLSKTYGLPGIRMVWLICRDNSLMETFLAAKEQIHICHSVFDEEIALKLWSAKSRSAFDSRD